MNVCECGRSFKNNGAYSTHKKTCKGMFVDKDKILELYNNGLLISQIIKELNYTRKAVNSVIKNKRSKGDIAKLSHKMLCRKKAKNAFGKNKVCTICNKSFNLGNFKRHSCSTSEIANEIMQLYKNHSMRDITQLGYPRSIVRSVLRGKLRSISEAGKLAHKLKSENFKHSDETKAKMRKTRLKYMKNNPQSTAWRKQSMSYPEKVFKQLIEKHQLGKKYDIVNEYSIFPYFIDFAFVNIKLAIEIDGEQHYTMQSKIDRDKQKDELLISKGWKVYRIPAFKIQNEFEDIEKSFLEYLMSFSTQPKMFNFTNDIIKRQQLKKLKKQKRIERQKTKLRQNDDKIKNRKKLLLESNIDFSKFGWIKQASKLFNITPQRTAKWIRKYIPDFYESCFKINRNQFNKKEVDML